MGGRDARRGPDVGAHVRAVRLARRRAARPRPDPGRRRHGRTRASSSRSRTTCRPSRTTPSHHAPEAPPMIDQVVHLLGYDFAQNAIAAGIVIADRVGRRQPLRRRAQHVVRRARAWPSSGSPVRPAPSSIGVSPVIGLLAGTTITALFIGALGVRAARARRGRRRRHGLRARARRALPDALSRATRRRRSRSCSGRSPGVSRGDVLLLIGDRRRRRSSRSASSTGR